MRLLELDFESDALLNMLGQYQDSIRLGELEEWLSQVDCETIEESTKNPKLLIRQICKIKGSALSNEESELIQQVISMAYLLRQTTKTNKASMSMLDRKGFAGGFWGCILMKRQNSKRTRPKVSEYR